MGRICTFVLVAALCACGDDDSGGYHADAGVAPDAEPEPGCSSTGLCVEQPFGEPIDYEDVWGAADDALWVVGERGTVRFFDGQAWASRDPDPAGGADLVAVHGSGPSDVWVVGKAGTIWHWTGAAWTHVTSGTAEDLYDVWTVSSSEAYACGGAQTMLRWNGSSWTPMAVTGASGVLRSVHALSSARVVTTDGGAIYEYDGSTWTRTQALPALSFIDVYATADRVLAMHAYIGGYYIYQMMNGQQTQFAAGGRAATDAGAYAMSFRALDHFAVAGPLGLIDHRQPADQRRTAYHGASSARGIWIDSSGRVWAVGNAGLILRLEPGTTTDSLRVVDAGDQHTMLAVHVRSPTDVWMAGLGGKIVHFDGATWTTVESGIDLDLRDIAAAPDGSIWAVGVRGGVVQIGSDGPVRRDLANQDADLWAVEVDGTSNVWVAGGVFEHWTGSAWTPVQSLSTFATDAWSPRAGEVWLSRSGGFITRVVDGAMQAVPRARQNDQYSIWGTDANNVIAGGYASDIYRYDGIAWTEEANPHGNTPGGFYGVWGTGPDNIYAVGSHVIHYDGAQWNDADIDGLPLRRVHGSGDEVWAVGYDQTFVHKTAR